MEKKPKKYEDIQSTSKKLFWKHGFKRISIEEICEKANVSKMTFYKYFPNKIELAKSVLETEIGRGLENFRQTMNENTPADVKIKKILSQKLANTDNISQEFLIDFYKSEELGLKEFVEQQTKRAWDEMFEEFNLAQEKGIFRKNINMEFFFAYAMKSIDLMTDEKLLKQFGSPQDLIIELANLIVYGIVPHEAP